MHAGTLTRYESERTMLQSNMNRELSMNKRSPPSFSISPPLARLESTGPTSDRPRRPHRLNGAPYSGTLPKAA